MFKPDIAKLRARRDVKGLIRALGDPRVHSDAINALGYVGDAEAVLPLIVCLRDPHPFDRAWAASALANIGEPAVELLIRATKVPEIRALALRSLGRIAASRNANAPIGVDERVNARIVQVCEDALRDPDPEVQREAKSALSNILSSKDIPRRRQAEEEARAARERLRTHGSCILDGHLWSEGVVGGGFHQRCERCGALRHVDSGNITPGPGR